MPVHLPAPTGEGRRNAAFTKNLDDAIFHPSVTRGTHLIVGLVNHTAPKHGGSHRDVGGAAAVVFPDTWITRAYGGPFFSSTSD